MGPKKHWEKRLYENTAAKYILGGSILLVTIIYLVIKAMVGV
jgi:hypothetical protein